MSFLCASCESGEAGSGTFPSDEELEDHLREIHLGWRPYACAHCDTVFSSIRNMKLHSRMQHAHMDFEYKVKGNDKKEKELKSLKDTGKRVQDSELLQLSVTQDYRTRSRCSESPYDSEWFTQLHQNNKRKLSSSAAEFESSETLEPVAKYPTTTSSPFANEHRQSIPEIGAECTIKHPTENSATSSTNTQVLPAEDEIQNFASYLSHQLENEDDLNLRTKYPTQTSPSQGGEEHQEANPINEVDDTPINRNVSTPVSEEVIADTLEEQHQMHSIATITSPHLGQSPSQMVGNCFVSLPRCDAQTQIEHHQEDQSYTTKIEMEILRRLDLVLDENLQMKQKLTVMHKEQSQMYAEIHKLHDTIAILLSNPKSNPLRQSPLRPLPRADPEVLFEPTTRPSLDAVSPAPASYSPDHRQNMTSTNQNMTSTRQNMTATNQTMTLTNRNMMSFTSRSPTNYTSAVRNLYPDLSQSMRTNDRSLRSFNFNDSASSTPAAVAAPQISRPTNHSIRQQAPSRRDPVHSNNQPNFVGEGQHYSRNSVHNKERYSFPSPQRRSGHSMDEEEELYEDFQVDGMTEDTCINAVAQSVQPRKNTEIIGKNLTLSKASKYGHNARRISGSASTVPVINDIQTQKDSVDSECKSVEFITSYQVLETSFVAELLLNPRPEWFSAEPPEKPTGGAMYIYDTRNQPNSAKKRRNLRCDLYRWLNSCKKTFRIGNIEVEKRYFYIDVGKQQPLKDTRFQRHEYSIKGWDNFVLFHYYGDHTVAVDFAHRNSTKTSNNFYTTSSAVHESVAQLMGQNLKPQEIYRRQIQSKVSLVSLPRNAEQIKNSVKRHRMNSQTSL